MNKNRDSLHRIDLSDENKQEIEELKSSLTDSLESVSRLHDFSPTSTAMSSLPGFDARVTTVSQITPTSPSSRGMLFYKSSTNNSLRGQKVVIGSKNDLSTKKSS